MIVLLIVIACFVAGSVLSWTVVNRPRENSYSLEIQRVDRLTQDAKDRMRRRTQRAEDQLRRLSKWQ